MITCLENQSSPTRPLATRPGVIGPASAANRLPHPSGARTAANFRLPQSRLAVIREDLALAQPIGFLSRLIVAARAQAEVTAATANLQTSVRQLFTLAGNEDWSGRELARRTGIAERTLRRMRAGNADPLAWLPKIQTALARITQDGESCQRTAGNGRARTPLHAAPAHQPLLPSAHA